MSFLCSLGVILGLPWRLPLLFSLLNPSPRLTVLVLGLPGPPPNLRSSSSPGQDCENYITLLERQGEGLLVCGTNARRPSCWSLVRRPLPICLVSSLLSGLLLPKEGGGVDWPHLVLNTREDGDPGWEACPYGRQR